MNHPLFQLFKEKGELLSAPSNTLLSCQREKETLWFLEEGSVNLFAIELQNGSPEGVRTFLSHLLSPILFFPIDEKETFPLLELFALSESPVQLWKLPKRLLEESLLAQPALQPLFSSSLESWIRHMALFAEKRDKEKHDLFLTSSQELSCEENKSFSVKRALDTDEKKEVIWVEILQGQAAFQDAPSLILEPLQDPFPLTYHLWLTAVSSLHFKTSSTESVVKERRWHAALSYFHHILFGYYRIREEKKKESLPARLDRKIREEHQTLNSVFKGMVSLLNPEKAALEHPSAHPLFLSCLLLGKWMHIDFVLPENLTKESDLFFQLSEICNASLCRFREVRLTHGWWKEDSGPLLGFYKENQQPVCLRCKKSGYEVIDPSSKERKVLTEESARELLSAAYAFYRPFPAHLRKAKEVVFFFLQTHFKDLIPIFLYGILSSLAALFVPFATAAIFGRAIPDSNRSLLLQLSLGLLLSALSTALFFYLRSMALVRLSGHASHELQASLWDRLLKLPVSFFRQFTTGNLVQRVTAIEQIRQILSDNASRVILSGFFSLFYVIAMLFYSPALTLIALAIFSITFALTLIAFYKKAILEKKIQSLTNEINGLLVQIISGVGKLRVAGAENNAFSRWATLFTRLKKRELGSQRIYNIILNTISLLPLLSYAALFGEVMFWRASGSMSTGSFLGFNAAFMILTFSLLDLSDALMQIVPVPALWNTLHPILDTPQERISEKIKIEKLTGEIRVDEVSFYYDKEEALVLDNISFYVDPKEFIALVGPSGSGKSTLIRLLLGFELPVRGTIYYEGHDLLSLNLHEVRKQTGAVLQTSGIIAGTLYENLVCGGLYSQEEIDSALALSGFSQDLDAFPMGLHTFIPMGGETLSGGQKQRLLIARALLAKPRLLLFDEATSALDNKVQDEISRNLEALDITRIVVAHRLSTIKHADRIYVLDKGKIIQTGSFEELAKAPGLFAQMLARQRL